MPRKSVLGMIAAVTAAATWITWSTMTTPIGHKPKQRDHERSNSLAEADTRDGVSSETVDVVLTSFFNSAPDPQSYRKTDLCAEYIRNLYHSTDHLGLSMVVFHDGACDTFATTATTHRISFIKVELPSTATPNDYRFVAARDWLAASPTVRWLFLVDGRDIIFHRSPFEHMQRIYDANKSTLVVSPDGPPTIDKNSFVRNQIKSCLREGRDPPNFPWTQYSKCPSSVHVDADHTLVNPMRDCRNWTAPTVLHNKCRVFINKPCLEIDKDGKYAMLPFTRENGTECETNVGGGRL